MSYLQIQVRRYTLVMSPTIYLVIDYTASVQYAKENVAVYHISSRNRISFDANVHIQSLKHHTNFQLAFDVCVKKNQMVNHVLPATKAARG